MISFEDEAQRTSYKRYDPPAAERKKNVMIDGKNVFDQSVRNNLITYDSIWKVSTWQGDDYTTGCLLEYNHFKNYYKMIAIDLSKQWALNTDLKTIQQISFTKNPDRPRNATVFFIIKEAREIVLDFSKELEKYSDFIFLL